MKLAAMAKGALNRAGYLAHLISGKPKRNPVEMERCVDLGRAMQEMTTCQGWREVTAYIQGRRVAMVQTAKVEDILLIRERLDELARIEAYVSGSISNGLWAMENLSTGENDDA